jgi:hypothetical protein
MAILNFSPEVMRVAAAAQRVAYGEGWQSVQTFMTGLGQTGWSAITGTFGGVSVDPRGFYLKNNAAAFAAERDGAIVISIRGSNDPNDSVPSENGLGWDLGADWFSAAFTPLSYYENIQPFVQGVLAHATLATRVIITGHSLGAAAATILARLDLQPLIDSGQISLDNVYVMLFGSPGVPSSQSGLSSQLVNRTVSATNSDDAVPDLIASHVDVGERIDVHVLDADGAFEKTPDKLEEHN